MRTLTIEAHKYFKNMYAPYIIFYRVDDNYLTFYEDAKTVSSVVGLKIEEGIVIVPESDIFEYLKSLSEHGVYCKLVSVRNASGKYDIPDVSLIESEEKQDY